jgi:hypothetical protein
MHVCMFCTVRLHGSRLTAESKVGGSPIRGVPRLDPAVATSAVGPDQS